jgi:archaellum biogenesis ATPase FlaH
MVKEFLITQSNSVVLLIGLEYLITYNEFNTVLQFIDGCNDYIIENNSTMIISVSPEAFETKELKLLERNMEIIESSAKLGEGLAAAQMT